MLERHFHRRLEHAARRIAHDDVDAVEMLAQLLEQLVHALGYAHARFYSESASPERMHLFAELLGFFVAVVVIGDDIAPGRREPVRNGTSNPPAGPGDDGHLADQRFAHNRHAGQWIGINGFARQNL